MSISSHLQSIASRHSDLLENTNKELPPDVSKEGHCMHNIPLAVMHDEVSLCEEDIKDLLEIYKISLQILDDDPQEATFRKVIQGCFKRFLQAP